MFRPVMDGWMDRWRWVELRSCQRAYHHLISFEGGVLNGLHRDREHTRSSCELLT